MKRYRNLLACALGAGLAATAAALQAGHTWRASGVEGACAAMIWAAAHLQPSPRRKME